jgi:hypothetical protein
MLRPSVLDLRFRSDLWIVDQRNGTFVVYLGDFFLAGVTAGPFDLPSLNTALDRMRSHRPRRRRA